MSRNRREIDFFKYTQPDPEDNEVFFGPITLRELKRSVEVEEEVVRRRLAKKAIEEAKLENKENDDAALDRTFEILDEGKQSRLADISQRALNDVTQFHVNFDDMKLVDLSVQFSKTSMKPPKSATTIKQSKCLLDETVNFNESKVGGRLRTPLIDKTIWPRTAAVGGGHTNCDTSENDETIVGTPRLIKLSDTFITDMVGDMVLNTTISDDSGIAERVGTPDIFNQERNDIWKNSPRRSVREKMPKDKPLLEESTSFFARSPSAVVATTTIPKKRILVNNSTRLFAKSPAVAKATLSTTKQKTPTKINSKMFSKSPAPGAMLQGQSRKQTPNKSHASLFAKSPAAQGILSLPKKVAARDANFLFPKSPVADYIHLGKEVKSMSKARHSSCVQIPQDVRSKSESKIVSQSKIPVSTGGSVKRKLNLGELYR